MIVLLFKRHSSVCNHFLSKIMFLSQNISRLSLKKSERIEGYNSQVKASLLAAIDLATHKNTLPSSKNQWCVR